MISRSNQELRAIHSSYSDRPQQPTIMEDAAHAPTSPAISLDDTNEFASMPPGAGEYVMVLPSSTGDRTDEETLESRYTLQTFTADDEGTRLTFDTFGDETTSQREASSFPSGATSLIITNAEDLLREKRLCLASSSFFFIGTLLSFLYFWLKNTHGLPLLPELVLDVLLCLAHTIMAGHVLFFEFACLDGGLNCSGDKKMERRRALDHMRYAQTVSGKRPFSREIRIANMAQSILFFIATMVQAVALISVNSYYHQEQELLQQQEQEQQEGYVDAGASQVMEYDERARARLMKNYNWLTFVSASFYFFSAATVLVVHAVRIMFDHLRRCSRRGSPSRQLLQHVGKQSPKLPSTNTPLTPSVLNDMAEKRYMSILTLDHIANALYMVLTTAMLVISISEFSVEDPDVRILGDLNLLEILAFLWVWIGALYFVADLLRWSYKHPRATVAVAVAVEAQDTNNNGRPYQSHPSGGSSPRIGGGGGGESRTSRKQKEAPPLYGAKSMPFPTSTEYIPAIEVELDARSLPPSRGRRVPNDQGQIGRIQELQGNFHHKNDIDKDDNGGGNNDMSNSTDSSNSHLIEMINIKSNTDTKSRSMRDPDGAQPKKMITDPPSTNATNVSDPPSTSATVTQMTSCSMTIEEKETHSSELAVTSNCFSDSNSYNHDHEATSHEHQQQSGDDAERDTSEPFKTQYVSMSDGLEEGGVGEASQSVDEITLKRRSPSMDAAEPPPTPPSRPPPSPPPSLAWSIYKGKRNYRGSMKDDVNMDYVAMSDSNSPIRSRNSPIRSRRTSTGVPNAGSAIRRSGNSIRRNVSTPECPLERSGASSSQKPPASSSSTPRTSSSFTTVARRLEARVQAVSGTNDGNDNDKSNCFTYSRMNYIFPQEYSYSHRQRQRLPQHQHQDQDRNINKSLKKEKTLGGNEIIDVGGRKHSKGGSQGRPNSAPPEPSSNDGLKITTITTATTTGTGKLPLASPRQGDHSQPSSKTSNGGNAANNGAGTLPLASPKHHDPLVSSSSSGEIASPTKNGAGKLPLASPRQPRSPRKSAQQKQAQPQSQKEQEPIDLTDASTEGRDDGLAYDHHKNDNGIRRPPSRTRQTSSSAYSSRHSSDLERKYARYQRMQNKQIPPPQRTGRFEDLDQFIDQL